MNLIEIVLPDAPFEANDAQAISVANPRRIVFVGGQIPTRKDGSVPDGFVAQAEQVWPNIDAQRRAAGMPRDNLVKVTTFLADRQHAAENRQVRDKFLDGRRLSLTVIVAGFFDEGWLLET